MEASVIPSTEGVSHIGHRQRMSTIYRTNEIIRRIQGEGQSAEISAANTKKAVRLSSLYNCGVGGVPKYKIKKTPLLPNYSYTSDDWQTFREKLFNSFYFRENGVTDVSKTTSSIVSFDVLRGILSTAYRTTFTPSEIHALAYELDVVKKLRGDVVVDLNSLLVKLKRLAAMVRDASTVTTNASAHSNPAAAPPDSQPSHPIHPTTLHNALSAIALAAETLWKTEMKYFSELLSLNATSAINAMELKDFLMYNMGVKIDITEAAMIISYCNGKNNIRPLCSDDTIPLSFLLKCLKLTAIGRKNWLFPAEKDDFLAWSVFVLQNKSNLITSKETTTITDAIENTSVNATAVKKLKMLPAPSSIATKSPSSKKKHVSINHSYSVDSIATNTAIYSEQSRHKNVESHRSVSSNHRSNPLLPTILGSHTSSMKGVGSAIRRAKTPVLLSRPSAITDKVSSKQVSIQYDNKATQLRYEFRWKMLASLLSQFYSVRVTLDDVVSSLVKGVQEKQGADIVTRNRGILVDRQIFLSSLSTLFPEAASDFIQKLFSCLDPLRSGHISIHDFHTSVTIAVLKTVTVGALLQGATLEIGYGFGLEGFPESIVIDCLSAVCSSPESSAIVANVVHDMYRYYFHQRLNSKSYLHPSVSLADNTLLSLAEIEAYVEEKHLLRVLREQHREVYEKIHSKIKLNDNKRREVE